MISKGFKRLAEERGFKQAGGVAFGQISGFMTTFSEMMGSKDVHISLCLPDELSCTMVEKALSEKRNTYKLQLFEVTEKSVSVYFIDTFGTVKRIDEFLDWFYPVLSSAGAEGSSRCPECKAELNEYDRVYKFINKKAVTLHGRCAQKIAGEAAPQRDGEEAEKSGGIKGFFGAILGGLIGAIPWAIAYAAGWFLSILGLFIGFAAKKGYTMLGGKIKKSTILVLIVAVIISVLFGQILGLALNLGYYIIIGDLPEFVLGNVPMLIWYMFLFDPEFVGSFISGALMALFFAGLGALNLFRDIKRQATSKTITITDIE